MQTGKANYRLAARLRGNELLLDADLRKAVEEEHLRAVRRAEGLKCCADRRAFAESVEWERLGDFFLRIGSHPSAVRAYRDAALACLDGDYYDHGTEMLPCRFLRLRFLRMAETATACCAGDARLRARKHAKEKRSDTCRYRTSLVRLVRLMRVRESHVCYTKVIEIYETPNVL